MPRDAIGEALSVDVAASIDVDDLDAVFVLNDGVDDPVVAPTRRSESGKLTAQGFPDALGVLDEWAEDEFDAGSSDLLWQSLQVAGGTSGDLDLVRLTHATP